MKNFSAITGVKSSKCGAIAEQLRNGLLLPTGVLSRRSAISASLENLSKTSGRSSSTYDNFVGKI
ncbi:hypothetical protein [Planktothricoides raciborskii]|uniref:Uncharacterized protein n=1 Tax=Planktothricoides raciborskii FACHB-1370 TaxID=2949576 RepID=A0ABR8ECZ4_9CYAN|nr:hypothetical protein [Planktothricoides raciborskii]MBD2543585.1 hypothetical protein [Planktothricoides raciborskii FACHB-1370]MBD2581275.1 hypothetical protein [Planktothricoides raciborskii FACHB-1261]